MFKQSLIKLHQFMAGQLGIDPIRLIYFFRGLPQYIFDWIYFRKRYSGKMSFRPCLQDRFSEAGSIKSEYFWQDLLVSRWIHEANPLTHFDVGSRIDGFIAHLASFRKVEIIDVRPISVEIPGVSFHQMDMMKAFDESLPTMLGVCDSISCLHAIEHFGLGRYGDPINQFGYLLGIDNIAKMLIPGGVMYLSTPIGRERVEFNANWIFDPRTIIDRAALGGMTLDRMVVVKHGQHVHNLEITTEALASLARQKYNLGIFVFKKIRNVK